MSYLVLLIQTCTVRRYTSVAVNSYGNPAETWGDHLTDQPCRISYPRGRQVQTATEVVPVSAVLFMEDVDVTEHDRIVLDGKTYEILYVHRVLDGAGNHHKELDLARVEP